MAGCDKSVSGRVLACGAVSTTGNKGVLLGPEAEGGRFRCFVGFLCFRCLTDPGLQICRMACTPLDMTVHLDHALLNLILENAGHLLSVGLNGYERVVKVPRLPGPGEQPVVGRRPPAGWKKGNPEENVGPSSLTPHHPQKIQIQILLSSSSQALPRTSLFQQRTSLPPL